jgi:uncharacterized membrane protein
VGAAMSAVRGLPQVQRGLADAGTAVGRALAARRGESLARWMGPWAAVAVTVSWSLLKLRATLLPVQYLDDASVHEQMVRFAAAQFKAGHNPFTVWFPYLGLGSPQFLHYQSLPSMLTGLAGLLIGPDTAFRWSLYLLWCFWPVAIYASARLFGLARWAAVQTQPIP